MRHIDALDAHDEPVFLLSPRHDAVEAVISDVVAGKPRYDLTTAAGVRHTMWIVDDDPRVAALEEGFGSLPRLARSPPRCCHDCRAGPCGLRRTASASTRRS